MRACWPLTDVSSTSEADAAPVELAWRTGPAGCLLPLVIGAALLFLYWGANPWAIGPEDFDRRNGWMVEIVAAMTAGGVGWGFLAIALAMALLAVQLGWRIFDRVAVRASARGLRIGGPFGRFVPWDGVREVRFAPFPKPPSLEIRFIDPQPAPFSPFRRDRVRIAGVEHEGGEAAAFAAEADRLRAAAGGD